MQALTGRTAFLSFPFRQRARIDSQLGGEHSLRQALSLPMSYEGLPDCCRLGERVVPKEPDDGGQPAELRSGVTTFPVGDRRRIHTDPLGHVPLQQPEIKAAPPQVIGKRPEAARICWRAGLLSSQVDMASRQRRDVRAGLPARRRARAAARRNR